MPTHFGKYTIRGNTIEGRIVISQPDPKVSYAEAIFQPEKGEQTRLISCFQFLPPDLLAQKLLEIEGLELGVVVSPEPILRSA